MSTKWRWSTQSNRLRERYRREGRACKGREEESANVPKRATPLSVFCGTLLSSSLIERRPSSTDSLLNTAPDVLSRAAFLLEARTPRRLCVVGKVVVVVVAAAAGLARW